MSSALSTPRELLEIYIGLDRELSVAAASTEIEALAAIVALAVSAVPGVEQASITDRREGRFRTRASTGDLANAGDRIQYDVEDGPCLQAILGRGVLRTGDVGNDSRFPVAGPRLRDEASAHSVLSFRLFFEEEPDRAVGLNLYSTQKDAFDESSEMVGMVLATHSALTLNAAAARDRAANLQRALSSNRRIGMAMGVLMATQKLTDDDAFTLLRIASQNTNRKLLDVADEVIATGALELPPPTISRSRSGRSPSSHSEPAVDE